MLGPARDFAFHNPLNTPDWDRLVTAFPEATFFHSVAWSRVLVETYQHSPQYLVLSKDSAPNTLLPLMVSRSWLRGARGIALPFTDECAPLHAAGASNESLLEYLTGHARESKWRSWEIRGGKLAECHPASLKFFGHRLDLTPAPSELFMQLESGVRRAIRKAEHSELAIEFSSSLEAVSEFYHLLLLTRRRHGLPPQPFRFFQNIQKHVLSKRLGFVVLARHQGRSVAGAVFFHHGAHAIYKFGASDDRHQVLRPNNLVMWRAIERLAQMGCTALDFGRTSLHNTGLRRFKLSWGTTERTISYYRYGINESKFMTDTDHAHGWHNQFFRLIPAAISRQIGEFAYRHVA